MAATGTFYRPGYKDENGNFVPVDLRAQDVKSIAGVSVETHMTDTDVHVSAGQVTRISNAVQGSELFDYNGKVLTSVLPSSALTVADISVADISALLALSATDAPLNSDVFVGDATGDSTVKSGWAMYRRTGTTGNTLSDWTKISEGEGLDVAMVDQTARDAANLLDAAVCEDETDMASKNLRPGALVFMAVENA